MMSQRELSHTMSGTTANPMYYRVRTKAGKSDLLLSVRVNPPHQTLAR